MTDLYSYLDANSYPGRGIALGTHGGYTAFAYFIMGRSENSRNRVFRTEGDTLSTGAFDESKVKDPSLIFYNAVKSLGENVIVTNGDQTDTLYTLMESGMDMKEALETREYEPDGPNYTPRISVVSDRKGNCTFSILKRASLDDETCLREFMEYEACEGKGHFISTYAHDGDPLPSFSGEPIEVSFGDDIDRFTQKLWASLNEDNKISLYVRFYNENGFEERLINKRK